MVLKGCVIVIVVFGSEIAARGVESFSGIRLGFLLESFLLSWNLAKIWGKKYFKA